MKIRIDLFHSRIFLIPEINRNNLPEIEAA